MPQQNEETQDSNRLTETQQKSPQTIQEILGIEPELFHIENQLISLFNENISPDYLDLETLHKEYVNDDLFNVYVYTLSDGKVHTLSDSSTLPRDPEIAGVAITGKCDRERLEHIFEDLKFSVEDVINETPLEDSHFPISLGKSLFVDEEHQGEGIGTQLLIQALSMLKSNPPAMGTMWAPGEKNKNKEMEKIMEKAGGESIVSFDRMWCDGWRCVECGVDNECVCGSVVYFLGL